MPQWHPIIRFEARPAGLHKLMESMGFLEDVAAVLSGTADA